jgi:hypothetical protein
VPHYKTATVKGGKRVKIGDLVFPRSGEPGTVEQILRDGSPHIHLQVNGKLEWATDCRVYGTDPQSASEIGTYKDRARQTISDYGPPQEIRITRRWKDKILVVYSYRRKEYPVVLTIMNDGKFEAEVAGRLQNEHFESENAAYVAAREVIRKLGDQNAEAGLDN